jgi:hypothetical protein
MSAAAFLDATHAELARLELELVRTGDRMTALKLLLSSYAEEGETAPKRLPAPQEPRHVPKRANPPRRASQTPTAAPKATDGRRPSWDVETGRALWQAGELTAEQIAAHVGAPSRSSVIQAAARYGWGERGPGWRPPAAATPRVPKTGKRQRIPATDCPHCAKRTTRNPCEGCGTQLAPGEVGKRRQGQR